MSKYSSIAVFYGSDSSEWEVACRSGEYTASRIDEHVYDVYEILARFGRWQLVAYRKKNAMRVIFPEGARPEVDKNDCSVNVLGEKVKFDFVYIMQHGRPGENGLLQGYFEMLGIPFSSCSAFVSAVAFDKYACKNYLRDVDFVKCAPDAFVRKGADLEAFAADAVSRLRFPVFVKPTEGGSSFGISRVVKPEDLVPAIQYAFSEGPTVLVEQGISGRELTCAAYFDGKEVRALPLIEIVSENDYFDYDAKYNGFSQEICPAPVTDDIRELVQDTTCKIYRRMGCAGVVRVDFILSDEGLYFLEINTIPGMTSASLVPRMIRTAGMDMTSFLSTIIEGS
ncbi:MAG: D-alanine--D-alanine ligase [Bacteroidales bacterium]|jgi:D-alanine-D-alanine ligase|nr:D-alanine--D-alanine ligase [Bacteroidales bacterium]MBQ4191894.1 D-alanine--D-alanine ligase [Bacteroidales bacterium]MBQ6292158.1 D-alanine--D-alanine ligase [Bacteroidales bacterium]MBR4478481.1 D-alanine--D-alanine ligase [Bacteroidales bacterium]MBR4568906.1 D-alanine--D-alanine ligase [Bacteroidales bacterium]